MTVAMLMSWSMMMLICSMSRTLWCACEIRETCCSMCARMPILGERAILFIRSFKINMIFYGTFFLWSFLNLIQFSLSSKIFRFRNSSSFCLLPKLWIGTKKILNAHWWYLHLLLVNRRSDLNKYTILKNSTDNLSTNKINLPFAILYSFLPITFIKWSISPKHLAVSFSFILDKVTFIEIPTWEIKLSISFF